jgi:hypothetical protein
MNLDALVPVNPIYNEEVDDSGLLSGYKMFLYAVNCPNLESFTWQDYYEKLFSNFSRRTIIQNIMDKEVLSSDKNKWKSPVSQDLFSELDNTWKFELGPLDTVLSKASDLAERKNSVHMKTIYEQLTTCLYRSDCVEILKAIKDLGKLHIKSWQNNIFLKIIDLTKYNHMHQNKQIIPILKL